MKKLNNKGFGIIEGFLIFVIIAIVGGTIFYVYKANSKISDGSDGTTIVKNENNAEEESANTPDENYLIVDEWGVRIPQMPEGNVISYEVNEDDSNSAYFVSSEQKALGGYCGDFSSARYLIYKTAVGYKPSDGLEKARLDEAIKNNLDIEIDGNVYYIIGDFSGGDCTGKGKPGDSMSNEEVKANNNLLDSLKGLVKAD